MMVHKASLPRTAPKPGHAHFVWAIKNGRERAEVFGQIDHATADKVMALLCGHQPEFCCELAWAEAKRLAWASVLTSTCSCEPHTETCTTCLPISFRKGGKWHAYKESST